MIVQVEPTKDKRRPFVCIILDHDEEAPEAEAVKALLFTAFAAMGYSLDPERVIRLNNKDEGESPGGHGRKR